MKAGYYLDETYTMTCPTCETLRRLYNIKNHTFNIRHDTLPRSTAARRLASKSAKRDDSVENNFLHCLVERPRGDMVHLDHLHLEFITSNHKDESLGRA